MAVPFPLQTELSPSRSIHPSPSASAAQWEPAASPVEFSHLFSSPAPSQSSQKPTACTPERVSHTPLTPPLTPASASSATDPALSAYATPPGRGSAAPPPTPASAGLFATASSSTHANKTDAPPSPVVVTSTNGWPSSPSRSRQSPHRLELSTGAIQVPMVASPLSARSAALSDGGDQVVIDLSEGSRLIGGSGASSTTAPGGERYLIISGIPRDTSNESIKDALRPCGDATVVKGLNLRFLERQGVAILAFYDSRHLARAEQHVSSQMFFGNRRLEARKISAYELRRYTGDPNFVDDTEGEVFVSAEGGKIDANSLQHLISSAGDLRTFIPCNVPNSQTYLAEFFDCRKVNQAIESLHNRNIFNIRLRLISKNVAPEYLTSAIPFPQNTDQGRMSQPTSPLSPLSTLRSDGHHPAPLSPRHEKLLYTSDYSVDTLDQHQSDIDTTNSSPFHGTRALPLLTSTQTYSHPTHSGGSRRISTGSVNVTTLGTPLHQSTSEQDLRRRAALAAAASALPGSHHVDDLFTGDHARRISDTFCFDTLRRAAGRISSLDELDVLTRRPPRARSISESSASPRVISPGGDRSRDLLAPAASSDGSGALAPFSVLGGFSDVAATPSAVETNIAGVSELERALYGNRDIGVVNDTDVTGRLHTRIPTVSDSSRGSPHTPSPPGSSVGASSYTLSTTQNTYYTPAAPTFGPMSLSPPHAQYYPGAATLGSPLTHTPARSGHAYGGTNSHSPNGYAACYGGLGLGLGGPGGSPASLAPPSPRAHFGHGHGHILPSAARGAVDVTREQPSERNQIDLDKIAAGMDTRTTVMIKNIPNKLSDKDLIEFIGNVCPRKIDFLYLRMDFQNGCNVGYAFVNFIHVEDLLHFAQTKLGVKWNMFSSEKVLQMSYANYQGKEALVEKFKNSCVMDEREAWRPKIFFSNGPNQGLPEPFPAPTHFRRKERSAQNRGALFVPSSPHNSGSLGSPSDGRNGVGLAVMGGLTGQGQFRRPNQHPQNLARHDRI